MKIAFEILKAQTKLEVGAKAGLSQERLVALMLEVAADLHAAVEELSPLWGSLTGVIKQLEKGKAK
jgi:hypothetical protein